MISFKIGEKFTKQKDVMDKLNTKTKPIRKSLYVLTCKDEKTVCLWFPKFYSNKLWENKFLNNQELKILEKRKDAKEFPDDKGFNRYTFIKRNKSSKYEFVGVFKGKKISESEKEYERIDD